MDPFARKMFFGSFVYGSVMLVMFAVLTVIYLHMKPKCSDRLIAEATDSNKQWTAAVMERRCGAEAPFFTHINVRRAAQELKIGFFSGSANEGEIFVVEQDAADAAITLSWSDANILSVQCLHCKAPMIQRHDQQLGAVTIQYNLPSR
jgi:hypothetical protein